VSKVVVTDIERLPLSVVDAFAELGSATVHEAMGRIGYLGADIRPIQQGARVSGSAITVLTAPGDNLMVHAAIEQSQPGDIIIVATVTDSPYGHIGDLMATQMHTRGVRGYVTNAGVRDTQELREMPFAVWTRFVSAEGTVKDTAGSVNVPIVIGSTVIHPGDVVVADDDGVTIVPRAHADEALEASRRRVQKEAANRAKYQAGATSMDINDLRPVLDGLGVSFVSQKEYEDDRR